MRVFKDKHHKLLTCLNVKCKNCHSLFAWSDCLCVCACVCDQTMRCMTVLKSMSREEQYMCVTAVRAQFSARTALHRRNATLSS